MKRRLAVLLWGVLLVLGGSAIAGAQEVDTDAAWQRYETSQVEMGVPFKLLLYAPDKVTAKGASDAAFARIRQLNDALSDYDAQSELSRLSATAGTGREMPVGADLWHLLCRSQSLAEETGGAFDVTVGPYVRLWRRARRQKELPPDERLDEARRAVGYRHVQLHPERQSVSLHAAQMRLDLGAIAKGYAVDEALKVLRERGISSALVDASGDVGALDPPPGKNGWSVGVLPLADEGPPTRMLHLAHGAVATSGDAFQNVEIAGSRYSHIVDPRTGLGLTTPSSVTVIAADCTTADSLATALSVLGPAAGMPVVERTPGAAALVVQRRGEQLETIESTRFAEFVQEAER